jgi:putative tricarboxylic transport membrane protein
MFDVYAVVGFGVLGYVLRKLGFPLAPVAVAFVLGSTLEETLRQGLLMSYNDPLLFLSRPVTLVLLLAALAFAGYQLRASRRLAEDEADK